MPTSMSGMITIPTSAGVEIVQDPLSTCIAIRFTNLSADNMDILDSILEQCRDIKLKLLEEKKTE